MIFTAPLYLLGLLPWAVVAWWLLPGSGKRAEVPFVALWRGASALALPRRTRRRWPGPAQVCALLSLLVILLAAARPVVAVGDGQPSRTGLNAPSTLPEPIAEQVTISHIGVREYPRPQVMVTVQNHSGESSVTLIVETGDSKLKQDIQLPRQHMSRDYFFDLPGLGESVTARIASPLAGSGASSVRMTRQSNGLTIHCDPACDAAVARMLAIYSKRRGSQENSPAAVVSVLQPGQVIEPGQAGIWIARGAAVNAGAAVVQPHPMTRYINAWPAAGDSVMPAGFSPLVYEGQAVLIAIRDGPARQVWINADLKSWETTTDFVVFFAGALDWIGGGEASYRLEIPPTNRPEPGDLLDESENVHDLKSTVARGLVRGSLSSEFLFAGLGLMMVSACFWERRLS